MKAHTLKEAYNVVKPTPLEETILQRDLNEIEQIAQRFELPCSFAENNRRAYYYAFAGNTRNIFLEEIDA